MASPPPAANVDTGPPPNPTSTNPATVNHESIRSSSHSSEGSFSSNGTHHTTHDTITTLTPTTQATVLLADKVRHLTRIQETGLDTILEPRLNTIDTTLAKLNKHVLD